MCIRDRIQPVSVTTGKTPSLKTVRNWYFDLERFAQALRDRQLELRSLENCRQSLVNVIEEFLKNPMIYVKNDDMEAVEELRTALPEHTLDADPHKTSAALVFTSLSDREQEMCIRDSPGGGQEHVHPGEAAAAQRLIEHRCRVTYLVAAFGGNAGGQTDFGGAVAVLFLVIQPAFPQRHLVHLSLIHIWSTRFLSAI